MNWEVIAYGSGDFLRMVFTAVASIFGNANYIAAVQTAFFLGFLVMFIKGAVNQDVMSGAKWFLVALVLNLALLVPKTTVVITDRILPSSSAVVNNVPLGLAATAGFFSYTGDWFSRAFETVFTVPGAIRYTHNGLLFGHKILEATRTMVIPDERTYLNFTEFFSSCVVVDGVGHGRFSWEDVLEANDLLAFFSTNVAEHAARFKYVTAAGVQQILPCRSGFVGSLQPDLQAITDGIMSTSIRGFIANNSTVSAALTKYKSDLPPAILYLTGINITPEAMVLQSSLSNTMGNAILKMSRSVDDAAFATQYARLWAENERRTTYQTMGRIAEEKLPLLRALIEAFLYAIFPIITLTALVMPTAVPFTYITTLLWINLWPPLYAILNFFISYYTKGVLTELTSIYGGGFNAMATTQLMEYVTDMVATSGYLVSSLPIIAWMLVSRSGALAAMAVSRIMQGYDTSVGHAAEQITHGEGQIFGERFRYSQDHSLLVSNHPEANGGNIIAERQLATGSTVTQLPGGGISIEGLRSIGRVNLNLAHGLTEHTSQAVSDAQSDLTQKGSEYTEATQFTGQALRKFDEFMNENHRGSTKYTLTDQSTREQYSAKLKTSADTFIESHAQGLNNDERVAFQAAVYGKVGLPIPVRTAELEGDLQGSVSTHSEALRNRADIQSRADEYVNSQEYRDVTRVSAQAVLDQSTQHDLSDGKQLIDTISSSLNTQVAKGETFREAEAHLHRMEENHNNAEDFSRTISATGVDPVIQYARDHGMSPQDIDNMLIGTADGKWHESQQFLSIVAALEANGQLAVVGDHAHGPTDHFVLKDITPPAQKEPGAEYLKDKARQGIILEGEGGEVTREAVLDRIETDKRHVSSREGRRDYEYEQAAHRINPSVSQPVSAPTYLMDSTHQARQVITGAADSAFGMATDAARSVLGLESPTPSLSGPPRMEQEISHLDPGADGSSHAMEQEPAALEHGNGEAGVQDNLSFVPGHQPAGDILTPPPEPHSIDRPGLDALTPRGPETTLSGSAPIAGGLSSQGIEQEAVAFHAGGGPDSPQVILDPTGLGAGLTADRSDPEPAARRGSETGFTSAAPLAGSLISPEIQQDASTLHHGESAGETDVLTPPYEAATGQTQTMASIMEHEDLRLRPYRDGAGWSIGYGHSLTFNGTTFADGTSIPEPITKEDALRLLHEDIAQAEHDARSLIGEKTWDSLSEVRKGVMIELAYQHGYEKTSKFAECIGAVQEGDWDRAAGEILDSRTFRETDSSARMATLATRMANDDWEKGLEWQP